MKGGVGRELVWNAKAESRASSLGTWLLWQCSRSCTKLAHGLTLVVVVQISERPRIWIFDSQAVTPNMRGPWASNPNWVTTLSLPPNPDGGWVTALWCTLNIVPHTTKVALAATRLQWACACSHPGHAPAA